MKTGIISVFFLSIISINLSSQTVLKGTVNTESDDPIMSAVLNQPNSPTKYFTDYNGYFTLLINPDYDSILVISQLGYKSKRINLTDSTGNNLTIYLEKDYFINDDIDYQLPNSNPNFLGFTSRMQVDFIKTDFSAFQSTLGQFNDSILSNSALGIYLIDFILRYNKFYFGIGMGFEDDYEYDYLDSLDLFVNSSRYTISIGYHLVETKRLMIAPFFSTKFSRYRLSNSLNENKIPLTYYVNNRYLDIRFNQLTCTFGTSIDFKFYNDHYMHSNFWTLGIYGGYLFKVNSLPWIYTHHTRLTDNREIDIEKYNIGIQLTFNFY